MAEMRSLIQGAELWVPTGEWLTLSSGAYGRHTEFARVSARSRFRRGEGLPGAVWATQHALIWRDLSTHFVRAESARKVGLKRAIGVPVYRDRRVAHVLTFLASRAECFVRACQLFGHGERGLVSRASFTEPPGVDGNALRREELAREVWLSPRLPLVTPASSKQLDRTAEATSEILLTLPIHDGIRLRGVACFEF
jgi:hypothetical protein